MDFLSPSQPLPMIIFNNITVFSRCQHQHPTNTTNPGKISGINHPLCLLTCRMFDGKYKAKSCISEKIIRKRVLSLCLRSCQHTATVSPADVEKPRIMAHSDSTLNMIYCKPPHITIL